MSLEASTLGAGNTLFITERRRPLVRSNVGKMVNTSAKAAGLSELNFHPHILRHSCGCDPANHGVASKDWPPGSSYAPASPPKTHKTLQLNTRNQPAACAFLCGQSSLSSLQYYYRVSLEEKRMLLTVK
jgi:integrase